MALFLPSLKERGYLNSVHMTLCSVGSCKYEKEDDFGSQAWGLFAPNLSIYGFDADADACEVANTELEDRQISWKEQHFPYAIADKVGEATLYVTQNPVCSSLYPPNESFLRRFPNVKEMMHLEFTVEIETTTLSQIVREKGFHPVDFCQIDVQGADLLVLQGARDLFGDSILAIQIEVEFVPLYVNQPLFSDLDQFLQDQGFTLFERKTVHRSRGCVISAKNPGQLLWADAFYFRDPLQAPDGAFWTQPDQIFKLACIADALDFTDYALELLEHLTLNYGKQPEYNFADAIVASLAQVSDLVNVGLKNLPTVQNLLPFLSKSIDHFTEPS